MRETFRCYPTKMLGIVSGMRTGKAVTYLVVFLKVHESGGICRDSDRAIANRTGLQINIVSRALEELISERRFVRTDKGLVLPDRKPLPPATRLRILERDSFVCVYCGDPATEADHIIPVVQGGSDDDENLAAACKPCNCSKGGRTPSQWAERLGVNLEVPS